MIPVHVHSCRPPALLPDVGADDHQHGDAGDERQGALPQGLVLMASITFALGVYRISKIGAIIEKLNAIESFSNVQIVCMDNTGTLTQNNLAVNHPDRLRSLESDVANLEPISSRRAAADRRSPGETML